MHIRWGNGNVQIDIHGSTAGTYSLSQNDSTISISNNNDKNYKSNNYTFINWLKSLYTYHPSALTDGMKMSAVMMLGKIALSTLETYFYPTEPQQEILIDLADKTKSVTNIFMEYAILAPALEEFLFRGCLMQGMTKVMTSVGISQPTASFASSVFSSFLFGVTHDTGMKLPAFAMSLYACRMTLFHKNSLIPSTIAHVAHNGLAVGVALKLAGRI